MFGFGLKEFITSELSRLKGDIADSIKAAIVKVAEGKLLKGQAYQYLDGILAEGQNMSKEKLDIWWIEKRAQLKVWAGQ